VTLLPQFLSPANPASLHRTGWLLAASLALGLGSRSVFSAGSQVTTGQEYEIKAAALYNIVPFVDWPSAAFPAVETPFVIGVLGQDSFAQLMEQLVANETVHGRKLIVRRYATASAVKDCQLLFIARSEQRHWPKLQKVLAHQPVLTVSDADNFAARGGSIQFSVAHNKLLLIVNLGATRQAGLTVSSKLLRLAEVVGEETHP